MPRISPAERPLMDLIVPFDMLKDLRHSHTPSTRLSREGSPFPIDVMLSDEAGRLPEPLFLKEGQCLELAACLYSPSCREGRYSRKLASKEGAGLLFSPLKQEVLMETIIDGSTLDAFRGGLGGT